MKVYVITSGKYSEYHIDAVALDMDEAESKCATLNSKRNDDFCTIEEYDTNEMQIDFKNEQKIRFEMEVSYKDGHIYWFDDTGYLTFEDINTIKTLRFQKGNRINIVATLPRGTEADKAKKIMLDRIAEFKAERAKIV